MTQQATPGTTSTPAARRALVIAPHYDDEVLGCGGLLASWLEAGAEVQVLFLTDAAGGTEEVEDAADYSATRRREAEAVAEELGWSVAGHLGLPDGALSARLDEVAEHLRQALLDHRPDALLVPSPLEASEDHRAAFAALHRLLSPLRTGDELMEQAADLRVLVYEINHPFYPELLVDVGPWVPALERAMGLYASQQQRHDYLAAALGLRRFRTLTLKPEVRAAEGYIELRLVDFTTRSAAQLIRRLGGTPELLEVREGAPLSVVVRTRNRPELLAEALDSLADNPYRRAEVVLVNDGGEVPAVPEGFPHPVVAVNLPENQGRAAAAQAGVEAANHPWVCFLDDDDLAAPEHLATLAGLVHGAGVRVAYTDAAVGIYALAPKGGSSGEGGWQCLERRLPYSRDFDADLLAVDNYIPFNTLILDRELVLEVGGFRFDLPFFEDWELLIRLARRVRFHHLAQVTCEYRHFRSGGHHIFGESPRQRHDFLEVKARVLAEHGVGSDAAALARAVDLLRAEAVEQGEAVAARRREAEERREEAEALRRKLVERDDAYHRLNGRLESLLGDYQRVEEQMRHHAAEEEALRRVVGEQEEHLGQTHAEIQRLEAAVREQSEHLERTYAEIQRLNQLIESMEQTRAWRLHQWLQRRGRS
ncbi:MAG: PIG-L family deacetylase [Acidobacteriota bacterium]|nr:PIG-L family deacetylase [Acidobacteriota bacterium]